MVRVATLNIHHGRGIDGRLDLERTAAVLRSTGAGLFALQELDRGLERSGRVDQPSLLGDLLDLPLHFQPTLVRGGGEYGIAVAAPDLGEVRSVELPRVGSEEPRVAIVMPWRGYRVIVTHLSQMRTARSAQVTRLAEVATEAGSEPVLILGDLNAGRRGLRSLAAVGFGGWATGRSTERGWPRRIDHVLAGPGAVVRSVEVVPSGASDHRAVVAEVGRTR